MTRLTMSKKVRLLPAEAGSVAGSAYVYCRGCAGGGDFDDIAKGHAWAREHARKTSHQVGVDEPLLRETTYELAVPRAAAKAAIAAIRNRRAV